MGKGEFVDAPIPVALDTIVGVGLVAVARIAEGRADDRYVTAMLLALARALGLEPKRAAAILSEPLAPLDFGADSLLVRTHARLKKQKRSKGAGVRRHIRE